MVSKFKTIQNYNKQKLEMRNSYLPDVLCLSMITKAISYGPYLKFLTQDKIPSKSNIFQ